MKQIMLSLLLLAAGYFLQAQSPAPKLVIRINGGASLPTGNFAKADYSDYNSGFAGPGGHFNLTLTYRLSAHFGVTALFGYSGFAFKNTQSLSDGYKEDSGTDSTTLYSKGSNHSLSFLIGPVYTINAGKKLFIDVRALIGYVHTTLAGFQIFYEDYTDNAMTQKESSGDAFGFQGGIAVGYRISSKFAVQVNADYFTSKPSIDISYDDFVVNSGRRLTEYHQPISGINLTAGITYAIF